MSHYPYNFTSNGGYCLPPSQPCLPPPCLPVCPVYPVLAGSTGPTGPVGSNVTLGVQVVSDTSLQISNTMGNFVIINTSVTSPAIITMVASAPWATGSWFEITNEVTGSFTFTDSQGFTFNGAGTYVWTPTGTYERLHMFCRGTNWFVHAY